jgi:hypothetical protein
MYVRFKETNCTPIFNSISCPTAILSILIRLLQNLIVGKNDSPSYPSASNPSERTINSKDRLGDSFSQWVTRSLAVCLGADKAFLLACRMIDDIPEWMRAVVSPW